MAAVAWLRGAPGAGRVGRRVGRSHGAGSGWSGLGSVVEGRCEREALLQVRRVAASSHSGSAEALAEGFDGLVDGEAGVVGGDLEEHAAGLAEVDGVEVGAVLDGVAGRCCGDLRAPVELGGVVGGAEGDVVDGAGAGAAVVGCAGRRRCRCGCRARCLRGAAKRRRLPFFGDLLEAHHGERGGGFGGVELQHGDAEEAADGVLGGDVGEARGGERRSASAWATSSSFMPSGSAKVRTSSPKRAGLLGGNARLWTRRCSQ